MKKILILFALFLAASTWSIAQTAPLALSNEKTEEYCEIRVFSKSLIRSKTTARVDFGHGEINLKDEAGKDVEFASNVAVLNYMNSKGWKLVAVHNRIWDGDSFTYYVMKRSVE